MLREGLHSNEGASLKLCDELTLSPVTIMGSEDKRLTHLFLVGIS